VHFAASAYVAESVTDPRKYFENNLIKTISLLNVLVDEGVKDFVFSSTCAIYGVPERLPISESHPKAPVNPYGESKLAIERVLRWYGEAYGLKWISLRYFNAAGADPDGEIGENHPIETHLIPSIFGSLASEAKALPIFGRDYPTRDGTAIRDYVHVSDLARAHGLALDSLRQNRGNRAYNLGTGNGYSVQEIVNIIEQVTGQRPRTEDLPGRKGDPPILIADASLANEELGWIPQHSRLDEMVSTAWQWHRMQKRDSAREVVAGS
jgi:UDP-glucose-4-epimerase GalE